MKHIMIIGGGFAGLNAAKKLGGKKGIRVTLIDRRNHHLFQPLLYQVAMAGLSPSEIATPIRSLLAKHKNITVLLGNAQSIDPGKKQVTCDIGLFTYDILLLACGARHSYFAHPEWEPFAPGLKTLNQATEIRRRVLTAFEKAESTTDPASRKRAMTFVIVGAGPTGVELAGAIGEMSRYTLSREFRNIDPHLTRIVLVEHAPRILTAFDEDQAEIATRNLVELGVQVRTSSKVTHVDATGVIIGEERVDADTVLWAAGVEASRLGNALPVKRDRQNRLVVRGDLSLEAYPDIFVAGDQAHLEDSEGAVLPGLAPVAMQQGRYFANLVLQREAGKEVPPFRYHDKGKMATIGRSKAIAQTGSLKMHGFIAWLAWLFIHVLYLTGFRNRLFVVLQWGWSYVTFRGGSRLIVGKQWQFHEEDQRPSDPEPSGD